MGKMFGAGQGQNQPPMGPPLPQSAPSAEALPLINLEVLNTYTGEWQKVSAHNVQIDHGVLMLVKVVNADEACTMQRVVPIEIFAPSEWRRCKTDYAGYRKSPLAI